MTAQKLRSGRCAPKLPAFLSTHADQAAENDALLWLLDHLGITWHHVTREELGVGSFLKPPQGETVSVFLDRACDPVARKIWTKPNESVSITFHEIMHVVLAVPFLANSVNCMAEHMFLTVERAWARALFTGDAYQQIVHYQGDTVVHECHDDQDALGLSPPMYLFELEEASPAGVERSRTWRAWTRWGVKLDVLHPDGTPHLHYPRWSNLSKRDWNYFLVCHDMSADL